MRVKSDQDLDPDLHVSALFRLRIEVKSWIRMRIHNTGAEGRYLLSERNFRQRMPVLAQRMITSYKNFTFVFSIPDPTDSDPIWLRNPNAEHTYPLDFSVEDRFFSELSVKARDVDPL